MSLIGKRQTRLLVLMLTAAVALAAVLIAGSTPANAAKPLPPCDFSPTTPDPLCLLITDVSPDPGATDVPLSPAFVEATFNQMINVEDLSRKFRVENVATGENVASSWSFSPDGRIGVFVTNPQGAGLFECGTTYEATVGGRGKRAVTSFESGLPILPRQPASGDIVTFERGGAVTWTFTTVACPQP
jgi:hypothetical protein